MSSTRTAWTGSGNFSYRLATSVSWSAITQGDYSSCEAGVTRARGGFMTKPPDIPADLRALMAEIGPKWADDTKGHVRLMVEKFSEVLKSSPKEGIQVETVRYGPHERQAFEVFHPADAGSA